MQSSNLGEPLLAFAEHCHWTVAEIIEEAKALHELLVADTHMIFAEYVHLMTSNHLLQKYCSSEGGDWHKRSHEMRKYRDSFSAPLSSHRSFSDP